MSLSESPGRPLSMDSSPSKQVYLPPFMRKRRQEEVEGLARSKGSSFANEALEQPGDRDYSRTAGGLQGTAIPGGTIALDVRTPDVGSPGLSYCGSSPGARCSLERQNSSASTRVPSSAWSTPPNTPQTPSLSVPAGSSCEQGSRVRCLSTGSAPTDPNMGELLTFAHLFRQENEKMIPEAEEQSSRTNSSSSPRGKVVDVPAGFISGALDSFDLTTLPQKGFLQAAAAHQMSGGGGRGAPNVLALRPMRRNTGSSQAGDPVKRTGTPPTVEAASLDSLSPSVVSTIAGFSPSSIVATPRSQDMSPARNSLALVSPSPRGPRLINSGGVIVPGQDGRRSPSPSSPRPSTPPAPTSRLLLRRQPKSPIQEETGSERGCMSPLGAGGSADPTQSAL
ncbi:unnamed protein product [Amoebophrya sp. A25]|nr:unnamed protein product [Amoebophrya sp. A25]|eukprot:GSA25T00011641001.1